jgi:hypothetical protein
MAKARISTVTGPVAGCNMARTQHAAPIKRWPPPRSRRSSRRHFHKRQGTGLLAQDTPTTVTTSSSPRSDCPLGLLERKTKEEKWGKCKKIIKGLSLPKRDQSHMDRHQRKLRRLRWRSSSSPLSHSTTTVSLSATAISTRPNAPSAWRCTRRSAICPSALTPPPLSSSPATAPPFASASAVLAADPAEACERASKSKDAAELRRERRRGG